MTDHPDAARAYAIATHGPRPTDDPLAPPLPWEPPRWLSQRTKRTAQYLAASLYEENLSLRRDLETARTELAMYRAHEQNKELQL